MDFYVVFSQTGICFSLLLLTQAIPNVVSSMIVDYIH